MTGVFLCAKMPSIVDNAGRGGTVDTRDRFDHSPFIEGDAMPDTTAEKSAEQFAILREAANEGVAQRLEIGSKRPSTLLKKLGDGQVLCVRVRPKAGEPYACHFFKKDEAAEFNKLLTETPTDLRSDDAWIISNEIRDELIKM
jgi:hypothetical protein